MKKFIRKDVQVFDVIQFTGRNWSDCREFVEANRTNFRHGCHNDGYTRTGENFTFPTNDGCFKTAKAGDYLIKRSDGVWPYDKAAFEAKYQEVSG